ncbi:pyrroline-5-carboxylate reductase [Alkalisalibacterium limincola]|uniref:Pyrroline-5-carboxylate reductase n=1 Tax=Alkalisalibacterium limincola TaxID=2699169 RepID=A0A5C8KR56_9GAMM|nr:pyrroline-5-carboxylate reductase [Alkalisalibacterium limincola]TXK62669.1 pyrroline-5-carboxylate reductase [Alkalisalibacterium limincola]
MPSSQVVVFIGGGNMARSIIGGLVASGHPASGIRVAEPNGALREALVADFGVDTHADAADAVSGAAAWVLAVKPQVMREVCTTLADVAQRESPVLVSVAAGITTAQIDRWLGGGRAVVRTMPNTPALVGAGATGMYANPAVSTQQRALAEALMSAVGRAVWISEEVRMDAVTGISGSGPAYFFLLAEAMQEAGIAQGLDPEAARALVVQTALGAARMMDETGESAATLRERVTSPGGTTQAALEAFAAGGLKALVDSAVTAATRRGAELSKAND